MIGLRERKVVKGRRPPAGIHTVAYFLKNDVVARYGHLDMSRLAALSPVHPNYTQLREVCSLTTHANISAGTNNGTGIAKCILSNRLQPFDLMDPLELLLLQLERA